MKRALPIAITAPVWLTLALPAAALERTAVRIDDLSHESWSAGQSCTVRYYNDCTGWVWVWSGWDPGEQFGTVFHSCCSQAVLQLTNYLTFDAWASGWGPIGTVQLFDVQGGECPTGPPIASQLWVPPETDGWHTIYWNVEVPQDFLLRITPGSFSGFSNPTAFGSDHPLAGPSGPAACGTCFPPGRMVHSYYYGIQGQYCPGITLNDGLCDIEWCLEAVMNCPVATEGQSWGQIKTLYR